MTRIMVIGLGYVGLSIATLLSQRHQVYAVDINSEKVAAVNRRVSPIRDHEIETFFRTKTLDLTAMTDERIEDYLACVDYVVVAVPTDYHVETAFFDTSILDAVIYRIRQQNEYVPIILKSTIPIGYIDGIKRLYGYQNLIFMPEFLRETRALHDHLYPSRIIVGFHPEDVEQEAVDTFVKLLTEAAMKENLSVLSVSPKEAEAIKLFSNTYLAMRVAFFNELDTFAEQQGLEAEKLIRGISLDPRIGEGYNNPSFGYGGYCLPKDTKQLLANFADIPQNMMSAIITSNATRKHYIASQIIQQISGNGTVGIYRLVMKEDSDNFRESSIMDIMDELTQQGISCIVYEPKLFQKQIHGVPIVTDLAEFKRKTTLIVANRSHEDLEDVRYKVYTRDLFHEN